MSEFITLRKGSKDITNQQFGRLTVLGPVGIEKKGQTVWLCKCNCGNSTKVCGGNLRSGGTKSCGCLSSERMSIKNRTHGMSAHPLYKTWKRINSRCTNPKDTGYKNYGGRGIIICDEWQHDFVAFYDYVSKLPNCNREGYTLDRINNSLGYSPDNIHYATDLEQVLNRRNTHLITFRGKTMCLTEWARHLQMPLSTLNNRLKYGWSIERALTQKPRKHQCHNIPIVPVK